MAISLSYTTPSSRCLHGFTSPAVGRTETSKLLLLSRCLKLAAKDGLVETVRALVDAGAEVNHADSDGVTALYAAAFHGTATKKSRIVTLGFGTARQKMALE